MYFDEVRLCIVFTMHGLRSGVKMISIVMPVYNAENYLKKSIESIMNQTYPIWELILIDNGSEDDSYRICQEYAKKDERIWVMHQYQNRGVSAARNLGVEKVTGEYVTFLDADDWIAPDYLEQLNKMAQSTQADMLVCQFQKVYEEQRQKDEVTSKENNVQKRNYRLKTYNRDEYISRCLLNGYTHCWGVFYKLSLLDGMRFQTKITIGEDVLFLIDTILQAEKIVVTDYDGYRYYINENGAMKRKFTPSYMDQILCWQKAKEKLLGQYPAIEDKLNSILVVSTMLVVGKLSALSEEELKDYKENVKECLNVIKEYSSKREVMKLLPSGYALKVNIFKTSPALYMKLYGAWKK